MSKKRYILIFSQKGEPGTTSVVAHLNEMGIPYVRLDFEFSYLESSWAFLIEKDQFFLTIGDVVLDRESLGCVWNRRWGIPFVPEHFTAIEMHFAFNELNSCFAALYHLTPDVWVNDLLSERRWSNKIAQLQLAHQLGIRTPRTLVTSEPRAVRKFYAQEKGRVVFKSTSGTSPFLPVYSEAAHKARKEKEDIVKLNAGMTASHSILFTQLLDEQKLERLEGIRWGPVTFQEQIEKRADVRVTVVGNRAVACLIDSQTNSVTKTDFRRFAFGAPVRHTLIDLPTKIEDFINKYMKETGLSFGFMDFAIECDTDEWVFFECNPNGQWSWIDDLAGANISKIVARHLHERACSRG